ncbi:MAG: DUF3786 domain-containing protein [Thermodesulfobacteriota bacterium]
MSEKASIFEETLKHYLDQLTRVDLAAKAEVLGVEIQEGQAVVPLLGNKFRVSPKGVFDPQGKSPAHAVQVVLCRYLILAPAFPPPGEDWVSYRDFKDAAPFVGGFINNTEQALIKRFSSRVSALRTACLKIGGRPSDLELSYEIVAQFDLLPRIPLLLLFNDQDEEFPAQCSVLFKRNAAAFLDMECLAILGWLLTDTLVQATGIDHNTIM